MGNPFKVSLPELDKTQGKKGVNSTQNTQETRAAQEKETLRTTDIYSLASNGSGNVTFQNYDGFTKTSQSNGYTQDIQEGESAKADAKNASKDADSARSAAQKASEDDRLRSRR